MPRRACANQVLATWRRSLLRSPQECPSCAFSRSVTSLSIRLATRKASTLVSSTAVNARKNTPVQLQRLHAALERVQKHAANFVDLSRLQLALQGLESPHPTVRICILSLGSLRTARQLAHLLVVDPLEEKGQWESRLLQSEEDDPRSILLRYGNDDDPVPDSPLLNIIPIPSSVLRQNGLELLIAPLSTPSLPTQATTHLSDAALVPLIGTPTSSQGVSMVRHPVHKALLVAQGLQGCLSLGRWGEDTPEALIKVALDLKAHTMEAKQDNLTSMALVDVSLAAEGLSLFRESANNGGAFGSKWGESGIASVVQWLKEGQRHHGDGISPVVQELIHDLIQRASSKLTSQRSQRPMRSAAEEYSSLHARGLQEAVVSWAALGHEELRDRLDEAFNSDDWAKIEWYKLFWRVDDVEMIASRLLEQFWLADAEKRMIWLSGRAAEAGLVEATAGLDLPRAEEHSREGGAVKPEEAEVMTVNVGVLPSSASGLQHKGTPKFTGVEEERGWLAKTTVPELQRHAQGLVLQTVSLSAVSTGLSALVFLAWPAGGVYGAGAFAALGVVWSLRRLQRQWGSAKAAWGARLREQGRRVLKASEDRLRALIIEGPARLDSEKTDTLHEEGEVQAVLEEAQKALEEVQRQSLRGSE